jgi:transcriptional regulator with XRE-family HTH domain
MTTLKARLKHILLEKGWSQRELAKRAGVSKNYVQTLISGQTARPSAEKLDKIAKTAGFSYDWLSRGVEPRRPYEFPLSAEPRANETPLGRASIAARLLGLSEEAIQAVQARNEQHSVDPGPLYWFRQIEAEHCRFSHGKSR